MAKSVKLFDYIERKKAAGSFVIDCGDHGEVTVPPIELWTDEVFDTAAAGDTKAAIALLLGQEASDRFHAAGGSYRVLSGIVSERLGADVGESEASSSS